MKVLIICNNAFVKGNGLCVAVQNLKKRLRAEGIDARLMAAVNADKDGDQPDFPLEHFKFPIFEPIIYANGFRYAKTDSKRIREAVQWADVVHIQEAFVLESRAMKIIRKLNKPVVGTFHLFTENVTANLGIGKWKFVSDLTMRIWRDSVFKYCSHINCPTELVKRHLESYGFKNDLRVFSNGIKIEKEPLLCTDFSMNPINIACIGRFSNEKDQFTLLNAMKYSKYAGKIQLKFAGKGPYEKKYKALADKLVKNGTIRYAPTFEFIPSEKLAELARNSYLYIHCAWVEVEGLSCLEAIHNGAVPVIAEGRLSATSQFALDDRSLFPVGDARALAEKIDWWIEHPEERVRMGSEYSKSSYEYEQHKGTLELIRMYKDAIGR